MPQWRPLCLATTMRRTDHDRQITATHFVLPVPLIRHLKKTAQALVRETKEISTGLRDLYAVPHQVMRMVTAGWRRKFDQFTIAPAVSAQKPVWYSLAHLDAAINSQLAALAGVATDYRQLAMVKLIVPVCLFRAEYRAFYRSRR